MDVYPETGRKDCCCWCCVLLLVVIWEFSILLWSKPSTLSFGLWPSRTNSISSLVPSLGCVIVAPLVFTFTQACTAQQIVRFLQSSSACRWPSRNIRTTLDMLSSQPLINRDIHFVYGFVRLFIMIQVSYKNLTEKHGRRLRKCRIIDKTKTVLYF